MSNLQKGVLAACLCLSMYGLSLAVPAAAQTDLGPNIIDVELADGFACWQDTAFWYSAVNMKTGALAPAETRTHVEIPAAPLRDTINGPEIVRTDHGIECVGTAIVDNRCGIVRFAGDGGALVEEAAGLRQPMAPPYDVCHPVRYYARDPDGRTVIIWEVTGDDGLRHSTVRPLHVPGYAMRWLNCDELLVWRSPAYYVVNVSDVTKTPTRVTTANAASDAFPREMSSGERLIAIANGNRLDLYRDEAAGWTLHRSVASPDPTLPNLYSVEIFEWQGRPWISGFIAAGSVWSQSKVFLYDISRDTWKVIGKGTTYLKDPETLVLNTNYLGVYYIAAGKGITEFVVLPPTR